MKFAVDSQEVAQMAAYARNSAGTMHQEATAMMGYLLALQQGWQGNASAAFGDLAARWQQMQVMLEQNLEQISLALDHASTAYAETEAAAARLFAS